MTENRIRDGLTLVSFACTCTAGPWGKGAPAPRVPSGSADAAAMPAAVVTEALMNSRLLARPAFTKHPLFDRKQHCARWHLALPRLPRKPVARFVAKSHLGKSPHSPEARVRRHPGNPQSESHRRDASLYP